MKEQSLTHQLKNGFVLSYILLAISVFLYVLIRAIKLDITYDEAYTISEVVPRSVYHILNFTPCEANNHLLNSLAIKFLFSFLPNTLFVARLPNVFALILFLLFSAKICYRYLSNFTGICSFVILISNPFLLDFFGLARGYGIGIACELASLYFVLRYLANKDRRSLTYSFVFAGLTVLAALSNLYFYLGWVGVYAFYSVFVIKQFNLKNSLICFVSSLVLTSIIWEPIRKLTGTNSLFYGGDTGFYEDTLHSLASYTTYQQVNSNPSSGYLITFLLVFVLCVLGSFFVKPKTRINQLIILGLTGLTALIIIIQHNVTNSLYVIDRTALFFWPLIILSLCFSIELISLKKLTKPLMVFLAIVFVINFLSKANKYKTVTWYFDSHTSEILGKINSSAQITKHTQVIDYSWPLESGLAYYLKVNKQLDIVIDKKGYEGLTENFDFYIYLSKEVDKCGYQPNNQKIKTIDKDTILAFPKEGVYLFRRKRIVNFKRTN